MAATVTASLRINGWVATRSSAIREKKCSNAKPLTKDS